MQLYIKTMFVVCICLSILFIFSLTPASAEVDTRPPADTPKLVFIHHSCGENWLADDDGGLGMALRDNSYFVSDTNYGWGPDSIGDRTDIGHWWEWFQGPEKDRYLNALYTESSNNSWDRYTRLTDPGGENDIIMFKSCYPNSNLGGSPDDPPAMTDTNPLKGMASSSDAHTVANAKGIYKDLLDYFATRPDKMFVAVTAPPLSVNEATPGHLPNIRSFNNWLVNDWLDGYTGSNVFAFDFYNVLTSNGGNTHTNDADSADGNHHRIWKGEFQHIQQVAKNISAYAQGDSHPTASGNLKATTEFVPLLNAWYRCFQNNGVCPEKMDPDDDQETPEAIPPQPAIRANDQSSRLNVDEKTPVTVFAGMSAGTMSSPLEWWLVYLAPDGRLFSFTLEGSWPEEIRSLGNLPPMNFNNIPVFSSTLSPGAYTFYFGVDGKVDGIPNTPIWMDSVTVQVTVSQTDPPDDTSSDGLMPKHLSYQGAFLFPESVEDNWTYSGHAMAYYPSGDPGGSRDGYPGSLYAAGHAHQDLVGELTIPQPVIAKTLKDLPRAETLKAPMDITGGWKDNCTYNPGCQYREVDGLAYLADNDKIVWNLRDWYNVTEDNDQDSLGWSNPDMTDPQGVWHIGPRNTPPFHNGKTCNYLFKAPRAFADQYLKGKRLIAGNHREAGALGGSQGPTLFALSPWQDGTPPASGQNLDALVLVYYPEIHDCVWENPDLCTFPDYRGADNWGGGAWITGPSGDAVVIIGRKGLGSGCYGGPDECGGDTCVTSQGYHSYPYEPQMLFYDTADIIAAVEGTRHPWQVLPYHTYSLDEVVFVPGCALPGSAAWDEERRLLYVTETSVDDPENGFWGETVVHVWKIK